MYETTVTFRVLSEEPLPDDMTVDEIVYDATHGAYVMGDFDSHSVEITPKCMVRRLYEVGSDPSFFELQEERH